MPAELLSLKEKLLSIYIVYKDALDKKRAQREMHKLRKQMFVRAGKDYTKTRISG
jgi:hypothetical protein